MMAWFSPSEEQVRQTTYYIGTSGGGLRTAYVDVACVTFGDVSAQLDAVLPRQSLGERSNVRMRDSFERVGRSLRCALNDAAVKFVER